VAAAARDQKAKADQAVAATQRRIDDLTAQSDGVVVDAFMNPPADTALDAPPTARPGTSMHEKGLAIDFTCGGGTISRGSACFDWLEGHAAGYGLYNLPSKPWHWSANGQQAERAEGTGRARRAPHCHGCSGGRIPAGAYRRALDLRQMSVPAPTMYHRWLGWQAPALRRLLIAAVVGVVTGLALAAVVPWRLAVLRAWNATALTFLLSVAPIILGADGPRTQSIAVREDMNRDVARLLLLSASGASLVAVGFALGLARHQGGAERVLLVTMAAFTLFVSWTVVNTVFTLRYARLYYLGAADGIDFGGETTRPPDYRDFAYVAFTIGMTYQVSDTMLRDRGIRRTVLVHAFLSYLFGVVIVAAGVNVVAGLLG
jgi:uncharacterized membrane protein